MVERLSTVAGELTVGEQEGGDPVYAVHLAGELVQRFDVHDEEDALGAFPQPRVLRRFDPGVPPFDEVVLPSPEVSSDGERVRIHAPGGRPNRGGGCIPPETWVYEGGDGPFPAPASSGTAELSPLPPSPPRAPPTEPCEDTPPPRQSPPKLQTAIPGASDRLSRRRVPKRLDRDAVNGRA